MTDAPKRFAPATAKLTIASVEPGHNSLVVVAQYNPKELQVDKTIPWTKVNQANKANKAADKSQGIHLEFTGAEGRSMTVEMLFDGYEYKGATTPSTPKLTVKELVGRLEKLASVIDDEGRKEDDRRPHRCTVSWGGEGLPRFDCVIESLSTKYTMFSSAGTPLRATCTVKLKEANVVSMAKPPGGTPGAGTPAGGGPPPAGGTPPAGGGPAPAVG